MGKYESVIGLEVHAQVATDSKLFSCSSNSFVKEPNKNVGFFDIAYPGTLPILSTKAFELVARVGFAIGGRVNKYSRFDRKHYFYPDLPSGYQITQFYHPIVEGGFVEVESDDGSVKNVKINRIHLEQDAGKLVHDRDEHFSCVDFSRSGVPLMEIVSDCDIKSSSEATSFLKNLRQILRAVNASNADMEKGSFRCDANVSIRLVGSKELGTRCEIKNLNSFKFVAKAIDFEIQRQIEIVDSGGIVEQETRLFDSKKGETFTMRKKTDAAEYYYFPDPNLLPVVLSDDFLNSIAASLPELPKDKKKRYVDSLGLLEAEARDIVSEPIYVEYFDYLVEHHPAKSVLGWVMTELVGRLKKIGVALEDSVVSKERLKSLMDRVVGGIVSRSSAKALLDKMIEFKDDVDLLIEKFGLREVDNSEEIQRVIKEVILANQDKVKEYRGGRVKLLGFFTGQVVKSLVQKSDPAKINAIIVKELEKADN